MNVDPIQLKQENEALKKKIAKIKNEIEKPEQFDIKNFKIEDFQIDENDISQVSNIKKQIMKSFDTYNKLSANYEYISDKYDQLCKDKEINQDEFASIETEFQKIKINTDDAEKKLFSKMKEFKYETSKRKNGKIKNLLKENYDLRISKFRIIEELRVKKDQLTILQNLPINEEQNLNHPKDDIDKFNLEESENFIRSKTTNSLSSRLKLQDLKIAIEGIEFMKTIPDEVINNKKTRKLKENITEITKNQQKFDTALKLNQSEIITQFLDTLEEKRVELNKNRYNFYKKNISSLQQQLRYAEIKYEVGTEDKDFTIINLNSVLKLLKKFNSKIELTQNKLNATNIHLQFINSLFKNSRNAAKIDQEIGAKNDEYKLKLEGLKNTRFSHQSEINKICFILNIPLMTLNESSTSAHKRILRALNESIKYYDKDKNNENKAQVLQRSEYLLSEQNKKLNKLLNGVE